MSNTRKTLLAAGFSLVAGAMSCSDADSTKYKFGPKETTSLVIVFRLGVAKDAINEFDKTVISVPHESGNGIRSLLGIGSGYCSQKMGTMGKE
mgnify:FL=1